MKGTVFHAPLELNVLVDGEEWNQAGLVKGVVKVKNHGKEAVDLSSFGAMLAYGAIKKVKAKDPSAFSDEVKLTFPANKKIAAGAEEELVWEFPLDRNCPITEKAGSLFIVYGELEKLEQIGHLQLAINPLKILNEFLVIFENFHRFQVKDKKSKKGWIDVKIKPPGSKEFASLEQLNLFMHINDDKELLLKYKFKTKKLDFKNGDMGVKKGSLEFDQTLNHKQYIMFKDNPNQDGILKALDEILTQVKTKTLG